MPQGLQLVRRNVNLYRDPSSGELIVLKKSKKPRGRQTQFRGDDAGEDEYGEEVGARGGRRARRRGRRAGRRLAKGKSVSTKNMQKCILTGKKAVTAAGSDSLLIRPQHYFVAKDIVFLGTLAGTTITNVLFGELVVFNSPDGVDVSLFGTTSFVRDFIAGNVIEPGLDITIQFTTTGAGDVKAQVLGFKPKLHCAY